MKIVMGVPEYIKDTMVQKVDIIDNSGITWTGSIKARYMDIIDCTTRIAKIIDIVKDAVVDARNGKNSIKIYKDEYTKIKIKLVKKDTYLNASTITVTVYYGDEKIYTLYLEPDVR